MTTIQLGCAPSWEPTVVATNEDGLEWRTTTNEMGEFAFDLTDGTWSIDVSDDRLNVAQLTACLFLNTEVHPGLNSSQSPT